MKLLWCNVTECMRNLHQFHVTFATDCSHLVKMISEPEEWPSFEIYLECIKILKTNFRNSENIHVPRTETLRTDSLARNVRKQSSFVVQINGCIVTRLVHKVSIWWQNKRKYSKNALNTFNKVSHLAAVSDWKYLLYSYQPVNVFSMHF